MFLAIESTKEDGILYKLRKIIYKYIKNLLYVCLLKNKIINNNIISKMFLFSHIVQPISLYLT